MSIRPIVPEYLFSANPNRNVLGMQDGVLLVDDFYENYDEIHDVIHNMPVTRWKWKPGSKNFIDYYDCRPVIRNAFYDPVAEEMLNIVIGLIREHFKEEAPLQLHNGLYEFNYFKHKKRNVSANLQFFPHRDYAYNCLVYLDKPSSGGTAIYPELTELENLEAENVLYDVSGLARQIVPAKPNRLAIFKGKQFHGGYIEDHVKYEDDWRINHVMFFDVSESV